MQPGSALLLLLIALSHVPLRVLARVDIVSAVLVHEEHLPPIGREPTYTVARFVAELLKMQGDEIYSGRSSRVRPTAPTGNFGRYANSFQQPPPQRSARLQKYKEPEVDGKNFGSYNIKRRPTQVTPTPFTNVRINNSFRQQRLFFPSHTEAIFGPSASRPEKLVATTTAVPITGVVAAPVSSTTPAAPTSTTTPTFPSSERSLELEITRIEPSRLTVESLLASFFNRPTSPSTFRLPSASSLISDPQSTNNSTTTEKSLVLSTTVAPETTTIDVVDLIRRELKALKPSPRPFVLGKIAKKQRAAIGS